MSTRSNSVSKHLKTLFPYLRRLWICTFVAFVFLRLTLAEYWGSDNHFWLRWQASDAWGVIFAIALTAGGISTGYALLSLAGRTGRYLRDLGFTFFILFYSKVAVLEVLYVDRPIPSTASFPANLLVLCILVGALFKRHRVTRALDNYCLILSPIVPIYALALLFAPVVDSPWRSDYSDISSDPNSPTLDRLINKEAVHKTDAHRITRSSPHRVKRLFFFLFDSLSYHRTFQGGLDQTEFPNLAEVSKHCIVFHNSYSAANSTIEAVPGVLCGVVGQTNLKGSIPTLEPHGLPIRHLPSLFTDMQERGYRTGLYGYGVPYDTLFRDGLEELVCGALHTAIPRKGVSATCSSLLAKHFNTRFGPALHRLGIERQPVDLDGRITSLHRTVSKQEELKSIILSRIQDKQPAFRFFHFFIPHEPFIYNRDGSLSDAARANTDELSIWNKDAYEGNLHYADTVIGEIISVLKDANHYDSTLFIITADHSVRSDPLFSAETPMASNWKQQCRVPLLIHLPKQNNRTDIDTPFSSASLRQLLLAYIDGQIDAKAFIENCRDPSQTEIEFMINSTRTRLSP